MKKLADLQIGDKVFFLRNEPQPYVVKAKAENFIIATVADGDYKRYTIIDTDKEVCGPHDRTFNPYDFTKQEDIETCLVDMINGNYGIRLSRRYSAKVSEVLDLVKTLSMDLRAVAIGPDRTEIVVGYGTDEELAAWYQKECDIPDEEWVDYKVSVYPLDKKLEWEDVENMTLRELVAHSNQFPYIAGYED